MLELCRCPNIYGPDCIYKSEHAFQRDHIYAVICVNVSAFVFTMWLNER